VIDGSLIFYDAAVKKCNPPPHALGYFGSVGDDHDRAAIPVEVVE
jgi:hypothetical protein